MNLPAAVLLALLQRAPALPLAGAAGELAEALPAGAMLQAMFASVVALGAVDTLAGATVAPPSLATTGSLSTHLSVGKAFQMGIYISGNNFAESWDVTNTLPPGITASGAALQGGSLIINQSADGVLHLAGTPTAPGTYNITVGGYQSANRTGPVTLGFASLTVDPGAPSITTQPQSQTVSVNTTVTFTVVATGSPAPTYQWRKNGANIAAAIGSTLTLPAVQLADAGTYTVVVTNTTSGTVNNVTSASAVLTVNAVAPAVTVPPQSRTVFAGSPVTFTVTATGAPAPTYQWRKGATDIAGAISNSYTIANTLLADAGSYTVVVTNAGGNATSAAAVLTVNPGAYLSNLSVRAATDASKTLIVGFVMAGGAKPLLVRAAGPTLNHYGLTGVTDPSLRLFTGDAPPVFVVQNDNWDSSLSATFTSLGAFAFDNASKDAALVQSINGPHTAQANATDAGAILVEAYDAGPNDGRHLSNLSARFQVGTGDNILIAGFVLAGTGTRQLLIRAVGPKLADYGVPGVLANPQFSVYDGTDPQHPVLVDSNDNWDSALATTFSTLGAFALTSATGLPTNDVTSSAKMLTLQADKSYTVQVSGVNSTTGEALVEIYLVP